MSSPRQKFGLLRSASRVWAIASVHGEARQLEALHEALGRRILAGDKIVYLGNLIGYGSMVCRTLDEVLTFRREFLSLSGSFSCDFLCLRGSQEEMWQKLLQLQFATDPRGVMAWMLENGLAANLIAYGFNPDDGLREAGAGPLQLTRWTGRLRQTIKSHPGHYELLGSLRRAAFTSDGALLFVNAGLDPGRPLETQKDSFWWVSGAFARISEPYYGYRRVVRGFAPEHPGLALIIPRRSTGAADSAESLWRLAFGRAAMSTI